MGELTPIMEKTLALIENWQRIDRLGTSILAAKGNEQRDDQKVTKRENLAAFLV